MKMGAAWDPVTMFLGNSIGSDGDAGRSTNQIPGEGCQIHPSPHCNSAVRASHSTREETGRFLMSADRVIGMTDLLPGGKQTYLLVYIGDYDWGQRKRGNMNSVDRELQASASAVWATWGGGVRSGPKELDQSEPGRGTAFP